MFFILKRHTNYLGKISSGETNIFAFQNTNHIYSVKPKIVPNEKVKKNIKLIVFDAHISLILE